MTMLHDTDTDTVPAEVRRLTEQLRANRAAAWAANPNPSPLQRMIHEAQERSEAQQREQQERDDARQRAEMRRLFPRLGEDAEPVEPVKRTRKRKPSVASVIGQMK